MISPPSTQPQPPLAPAPTPAQQPELPRGKRPVRATPLKKRMGETPAARAIKSVLRPPIKGLYYLITGIRTHKWLSLLAVILLIASISLTTFFTTGEFPLGIGHDPWKLSVNGAKTDAQGQLIRTWLYALRDGATTQLNLLDANISNPPDPNQLVQTYSEKNTHLTWKNITVLGSYQTSDTVVDTIVAVDLSANGPSGSVSATILWHFATATSNGEAILLNVNLAGSRAVSG